MQVVFFVKNENLNKVKDLIGIGSNSLSKKLKSLLSKKTLGFDEEGAYLAMDAFSGATVKIAEELLSDYADLIEKNEEIINKIAEHNQEKMKGKYLLYSVKEENVETVRNLVGVGEKSLERQSITIRDNKSLGLEKEGNYLLIDGSEEACKAAQEMLRNIAQELKGKEKDKVVAKMKEMEDSALEGFGGIFG